LNFKRGKKKFNQIQKPVCPQILDATEQFTKA